MFGDASADSVPCDHWNHAQLRFMEEADELYEVKGGEDKKLLAGS
jgi:hypothetical protein